ncbi:EF-hand domain-containing protein [Desulfonema limicola]|uniref:EF-hand domain-containing protein n=1 Tax=Desulfonema limicola TaxID=45656 RepID=A0A975BAY2_9BACT|nr:hypothetical protein [Desulfonema limicola]QTA81997.1 EF-hand domain-containing protein [Desulfonema limicola]
MLKKIFTHDIYCIWIILLILCIAVPGSASNIDPDNKHAWSTNAGWISFRPQNGGVTVYNDHLEGYAWAENIGWIKLGSYTGGGIHNYENTSADNWGVNRHTDSLNGYAWSNTVGWINFSPANGGVSIDTEGKFNGYAWSENTGWIKFSNEEPAYYVAWQNNLPVAAIIDLPQETLNENSVTLTVGGSNITAYKYKLDDGEYSSETDAETKIVLSELPEGTHKLYVVGKNAEGIWQDDSSAIPLSLTIDMFKAGDIDRDGDIDLSDAVLGLKVMAGIEDIQDFLINPDIEISEIDVNGDGKIGMQDIIYILNMILTNQSQPQST